MICPHCQHSTNVHSLGVCAVLNCDCVLHEKTIEQPARAVQPKRSPFLISGSPKFCISMVKQRVSEGESLAPIG